MSRRHEHFRRWLESQQQNATPSERDRLPNYLPSSNSSDPDWRQRSLPPSSWEQDPVPSKRQRLWLWLLWISVPLLIVVATAWAVKILLDPLRSPPTRVQQPASVSQSGSESDIGDQGASPLVSLGAIAISSAVGSLLLYKFGQRQ